MIDWVTAVVPFAHQALNSGCVMSINPDGDIDWKTQKRTTVPGTYESSIQVRSADIDRNGFATGLWISGNPAKFLQGHNVFGSDDLVSLVYDTVIAISAYIGCAAKQEDLEQMRAGQYRVTRVDINYSYSLGCRGDVISFLRALEHKAFMRVGRAVMKGSTVTFGTGKSRYQVCVYSKGEELEAGKKHQLPAELLETPITGWANDKLRLEVRLKRKELSSIGMGEGYLWNPPRVKELYEDYARRIDMSQQISLTTQQELELPRSLRATYLLWRTGEDLRSTMPHNTYYRHRRALKQYGIDIRLTPDSVDRSNVVPIFSLTREVIAIPSDVPGWAFELGLIHPSADQGSVRKVS